MFSKTVVNILFLFFLKNAIKDPIECINVLNELKYSALRYVWNVNSILLSALNLDHVAVPSLQLLSELISQAVVKLGQ